jgi:hypothetical protein
MADFDVVSLGEKLAEPDANGLVRVPQDTLAHAAKDVTTLLQDNDRRKAATDHNFTSAQQNYSYDALETIIQNLLEAHHIS